MRRKQPHPLKAYRNAQEPPISQVEAARRFGISQAEWSRLERGIHRPNARLTKKLIEQTGASLEILMRVAS